MVFRISRRGQIAFEFLLGLNALLMIWIVLFLLITAQVSSSYSYNDWLSKTFLCDQLSYEMELANRFGASDPITIPLDLELNDKIAEFDGYECVLPYKINNSSVPAGTYRVLKNKNGFILRSQ